MWCLQERRGFGTNGSRERDKAGRGATMNRRQVFRCTVIAAAVFCGIAVATAAEPDSVSVLVTYHSVSGNTEKMAQGVAEGVKGVTGANVVLKRVGEVTGDDLLVSDAVIVGSPVYFGNMAGEVKTFLDNWAKFGLF